MLDEWQRVLLNVTGTPVQRHLRKRGVFTSGPPPEGKRLRVVVRDSEGLSCETAEYALAAIQGQDCSVWVTHEESGSYRLTDRGRDTRTAGTLWARYRRGEELVITAIGPDASRTLERVRVLLEARPEERRSVYRQLRKGA